MQQPENNRGLLNHLLDQMNVLSSMENELSNSLLSPENNQENQELSDVLDNTRKKLTALSGAGVNWLDTDVQDELAEIERIVASYALTGQKMSESDLQNINDSINSILRDALSNMQERRDKRKFWKSQDRHDLVTLDKRKERAEKALSRLRMQIGNHLDVESNYLANNKLETGKIKLLDKNRLSDISDWRGISDEIAVLAKEIDDLNNQINEGNQEISKKLRKEEINEMSFAKRIYHKSADFLEEDFHNTSSGVSKIVDATKKTAPIVASNIKDGAVWTAPKAANALSILYQDAVKPVASLAWNTVTFPIWGPYRAVTKTVSMAANTVRGGSNFILKLLGRSPKE